MIHLNQSEYLVNIIFEIELIYVFLQKIFFFGTNSFDEFGKLELGDAIRLSVPVIQDVEHLKELKSYITTIQSEVWKLLYVGVSELQLNWEQLYLDDFQIVKKRKF